MARKPPPGVPAGAIPIQLFPNQGGGFGYGVTKNATNPEGYDRALNMIVGRDGQTLSPSFISWKTNSQDVVLGVVSQLFPWIETSTLVPQVLWAMATTWQHFEDGFPVVESVAGTFRTFGACFHDDGSGVEYLYAGADPTVAGAFIARRTQAAVWTRDGDVRAKYLVSAAGAMWRTTSDYQISKCPAGSEPFTLASWGSALQVGTNYAKITALGALGAAPIVFKEDGIYPYNEADTRFENAFPVDPNPDNFGFVKSDNAGGIYTALHDGTLVHITRFGQITTQHYLDGKTPGRDTLRGPITDIAVWGDLIFAAVAPGWRATKPVGMKVLVTRDTGANYTDFSSEVQDNDLSTTASLAALPTSATAWMLIGFDAPFLAVQFLMKAAFVNTTVATMTVGISNGAGGFSAAFPFADSTVFSEATSDANKTPFAQSGVIAIRQPTSTADSIYTAMAAWAKDTYAGFSKYWMKVSFNAILSVNVNISEVALVVERGAPTHNAGTSPLTVFPLQDNFDASGQSGAIIAGRRTPNGVVWDEIYTLDSAIGVCRLAITPMATNNAQTALMMVTPKNMYRLPLPNFLDPNTVDYPEVAGSTGGPSSNNSIVPTLFPSAVDLGDLYRLCAVECLGADFVDGVDTWGFSFRWDETNPWETWQRIFSGDTLFEVDSDSSGRVLHTCFEIRDALATDPVAPHGQEIIAWVTPVPGQFEELNTQPARAVPEVT